MRKEVNNLLVTLKNPTTVEKSHYFSNAKPLKQWQVKRHDLEKKKRNYPITLLWLRTRVSVVNWIELDIIYIALRGYCIRDRIFKMSRMIPNILMMP